MIRALSLSKRGKLTALLFTTVILIVLLPSPASGQGSSPARGFQPGGSFALLLENPILSSPTKLGRPNIEHKD